jgi:predicted cupin superfamily sugar epimerase
MSTPTAGQLIEQLGLVEHPEGGWYRETYRSGDMIQKSALPTRFSGDRAACTAIYFLLRHGDISALHRIRSDELWHFYAGAPLIIHVLPPDGTYYSLLLGSAIANGEAFQAAVPAGCWFGAEVSGDGYALVGCTVAPGFDFTDFEMATRGELLALYPAQAELITRLTRNPHGE